MTTTEQMPERDMDTTHVDAQQKRGARVHSRAQVPRASKEATIAALRSDCAARFASFFFRFASIKAITSS